MKALLIILFFSTTIFGQENPWKNKSKENPWGNQTKQVEKKDTTQYEVTESGIDTTFETKSNHTPVITKSDEAALIHDAQEKASTAYNSSLDFGIGFTTGIIMNFMGLLPDIPYVALDSKQEKTIQTEIVSDSTYTSVDQKELKTKTKNRVKSKKAIATFGGTAVGSLVQIFAIFFLLN